MHFDALFLRRFYRCGQECIVRRRCQCTGHIEMVCIACCMVGADACHHITDFQFFCQRPCGAYADDVFHIIEAEQFVAVNTDGRAAHTTCHNRNFYAFVCAGIALHAADIIHQNRVFQKGFCNKFCAERIPGHQYRFCKIAFFSGNMRCCHSHYLLLFEIGLFFVFYTITIPVFPVFEKKKAPAFQQVLLFRSSSSRNSFFSMPPA